MVLKRSTKNSSTQHLPSSPPYPELTSANYMTPWRRDINRFIPTVMVCVRVKGASSFLVSGKSERELQVSIQKIAKYLNEKLQLLSQI